MARTSNIFARVEPEIKDQAEVILGQLGISMSNAIGLFLRQVLLQRGIPFDMKLPPKSVLDISNLSEVEFNEEIEKGLLDIKEGRILNADAVEERLQREFGI